MDKATLIELFDDSLNDDFDDGETVESFKAPLPDLTTIKHRGENEKLTKDEKKLLIHLQDLNKLRKLKKEVQAQVLKLQEEKKRKAEQEKTKKAQSTNNNNKLASAVQAKERAKLLLQSGAIKLPTARRANFIQHKRSMAQRNAGRKASTGNQDLSPPGSPAVELKLSPELGDSPNTSPIKKGAEDSEDVPPISKRPRMGSGGRSLYDNFVSGGRSDSTINVNPNSASSPKLAEPNSPVHSPRVRGSGGGGGDRGGNTLFVRGYSLSSELLTSAFADYGPILAIHIEEDGERAFVTLDNAEVAAKALNEVNYVGGICLRVAYARRQTSRTPNPQSAQSGRDRSTATWANIAAGRRTMSDGGRRPSEKPIAREMIKYD